MVYIMITKKPKNGQQFTKPFLIQISEDADAAVEGERKARGLKSRAETIRLLVGEALHRAKVRRSKGQKVEVAE